VPHIDVPRPRCKLILLAVGGVEMHYLSLRNLCRPSQRLSRRAAALALRTLFVITVRADAPDVAQLATDIGQAKLGPGVTVEDETYSSGHLKLTMNGEAYPVVVGTERVGVFLHGQGRMTYASDYSREASSFRTNVKRASRYELSDGVIEDGITAAVVWDPSAVSEHAGQWPDGEAEKAAQREFDKLRGRFADVLYLPVVNMLAQGLCEPPEQRFSVVQAHGDKHDVVHVFDTIRAFDETLSVMRSIDIGDSRFTGTRFPRELSVQPIGRKELERRPRRYVIRDVDLELVNRSDQHAELGVSQTIEAISPIKTISFNLWNRGLGPDWYEYTLETVTGADGQPVPFSHRDDDLVVELAERLVPGQQVTLGFRISGHILFRPDGDNYWILPISSWLPTSGRLDQAAFTYHAVIKAAKPFIPFSNGTTVRRWEEDQLACAEFRIDKPVRFPIVLAGKYSTFTQEHEGLTVSVSSYATKKSSAMKKLANNVHSLIGHYHRFLGDYPFGEVKVSEIDEYGWAMAPPGIIFITREAFEPALQARGWSMGLNRRLAHEVAHTWWGQVAKWSSREDQWLSESIAEYYSAFAISQLWRESEFNEAVKEWKQQSYDIKDRASIYQAGRLEGEKAGEDWFGLLYAKGPLVLHALRQELGDQQFFTLMKTVLTNHQFKHIDTNTFIEMTNWISKQDYSPWFDRYLLGTDWPGGKKEKTKKKP
jgi:hypothetical protein